LIYVVWHPAFEWGQKIAESTYAHFSRDPERTNARGLGIPVFFRSAGSGGGKTPPAPIAVDAAQHTAIIVLVDPEMVAAEGWDKYIEELWKQVGAAPKRHRLFPVAFDDTAYQLSPQIGAVNFIRLQGHSAEVGPGFLLNRLTNEVGRLLTQRPTLASVETEESKGASPPKMRLFISHAKLDGGIQLRRRNQRGHRHRRFRRCAYRRLCFAGLVPARSDSSEAAWSSCRGDPCDRGR